MTENLDPLRLHRWEDVKARRECEDRRRLPAVDRDALWELAAELLPPSARRDDEIRDVVRALLDARRLGAADALDAVAAKLEDSDARVHPRLLRALATGYRSGEIPPPPT